MTLVDLLREGRVERVEADAEAARVKLEDAGRHLRSSVLIAGEDASGAYALVYDAARKALDAHMTANGYRAKARPGAHEAVARSAREVIVASTPPTRRRLTA